LGWSFLYGRKSDQNFDLFLLEIDQVEYQPHQSQAISSGDQEELVSASVSVDELFSRADETNEIFVRRERVRAKKAGSWICNIRTIPSLSQVVIGTSPVEKYLHILLQEYANQSWTGRFGLHYLPLVQLAQPGKSPAVSILDEYYRMQVSPVDIVLEVIDWPGIDWNEQQSSFYQLLLDMSSVVWRRIVYKYNQYPWLFGAVLDPRFPDDQKNDLLTDFFSKPDCCLEPGAARDLKKMFQTTGVSDCLKLGSDFFRVLMMIFTAKSTNVEIECNFARSTCSRSFMHGQRHCAATMSCKHLLAELKHQHLLALELDKNSVNRKRKFEAEPNNNLPALSLIGSTLQTSETVDADVSLATSQRSFGSLSVSKGNVVKKQ